jgi:hypothetical protein
MASSEHPAFRPMTAGMRRLFTLSCALVAIIGLPLFLWPAETERNFAWTIRPPVTAAFLGAGYWASFVVVLLARRERSWARARIGLYFALAFAWLTLAATLLHLDRFHLGEPFSPAARIMTWTWLAVYSAVPVLQVVLLVRLARHPGGGPPRERPMPVWYRTFAVLCGVALGILGLAFMVAPLAVAETVWPWALTPLTGRATGAWLVAWGVICAQIGLEADWRRVRPGLAGLVAFGVLGLVVLARFRDALAWDGGRATLLAGALTVLLALGAIGLARTGRG